MTVSLSPVGGAASQFFNSGGVPLYGGKIYTYEAGTTTPKATYTEANGLTAHPNPIILDSAGRVPGGEIWLTSAQAYLFILKTSSEELIGTYDNLYGIAAGAENAVTEVQIATAGQTSFVLTSMTYTPGVFTLGVYIDGVNQVVNNSYVETSATTVTFVSGLHVGAVVKFININSAATSSDLVTYLPAGASAVTTTVQAKLRESVSVLDFGAVQDASTDNSTVVDLALASLGSNGGTVIVPNGCRFNLQSLTFPQYSNLEFSMSDDLSRPNPLTTLGTNERVYFSANSSGTGAGEGQVNEWRWSAALQPGIGIDVREDVAGQDAWIGPGQSRTNPARASLNFYDSQLSTWLIQYQKYASYSIFSGQFQQGYRNVVTLAGVGSSDGGWTVPSVYGLVTGVTSGAKGYVLSIAAGSTTVLWISGKFVTGEKLLNVTNSAGTITPTFSQTALQPLVQSLETGNWSIGLPPANAKSLFAVGGKIAATQARTFGQYDQYSVANPAFVLHDLVADVPTNGYEITYNTTPAAASRRVTLRKYGLTVDKAHIGAVHCHANFNNAVGLSTSNYNVAGIVRNGTGDYTITFTNAATRADYCTVISTSKPLEYAYVIAYTTAAVRIGIATTGTATLVDATGDIMVQCMGGDI